MPTRMRGSAIDFSTAATGVSPFAGRTTAGTGTGAAARAGRGGGGGVDMHAASREVRTRNRVVFIDVSHSCKNSRQLRHALPNPLVGLFCKGQAHGVAAAAVDEERAAGNV